MNFGCKPFGFITAICIVGQSATHCLEMDLRIQTCGWTFFVLELVLQTPLKAKKAALSSCSSSCPEVDETHQADCSLKCCCSCFWSFERASHWLGLAPKGLLMHSFTLGALSRQSGLYPCTTGDFRCPWRRSQRALMIQTWFGSPFRVQSAVWVLLP